MRNKFAGLFAAALTTPLGGAGWASLPELPPAPAGQAVAELLMLDAHRAIAAEHARQAPQTPAIAAGQPPGAHPAYGTAQAPHQAGTARPAPLLTSIYGVGKRLHAEVVIDGQEALFASGQAHPLAGLPTSWRLKRISPPCVDLESDKGGAMRLCSARTGANR